MKLTSFLGENEIKALKTARKVLNKIQKKISKLEKIRTELDSVAPTKRTNENGKKWRTTTDELYELLKDMYQKCHVSTINCESPSSNYLILVHS